MKTKLHAVESLRYKVWVMICVLSACLMTVNRADAQRSGSSPQQVKPVAGVVVDEVGTPVVGCSILVKGTTMGTTSDSQGRFSLNVPAKTQTLQVSYVGMESVEVPVGANMRVVLKASANAMDDVVVVGYGVQKKATLSGAVSSISNEDILTTKSPSLAVSLAGKVPGLRIRQNNGMPGSFANDINIRGLGTPIIVIDGVIRNETTEFQKLNPEDIESITVLKDASAAIYGINSSNGAILVTTKGGSNGPMRVTLSTNFGISYPTKQMEMMNVAQYWQIRNEAEFNATGIPEFSQEELAKRMALPYVDWYKEVFKSTAFQQQYNVTVEGGTESVSTYTNIGYMTDNGLLRSGDIGYDKYTARNSTKVKINRYLRADLNLSGYTDLRKQPGTWDDSFMYLNKATHGIVPSETVYANNNSNYYNQPAPLDDNPVYFAQRELAGYGEWRDFMFQGSLGLTLDIPGVKGLSLRAQVAYDYKSTVRTRVQKRIVHYVYSAETDTYKESANGAYTPSIEEQNWLTNRLDFQGSINYKNTFADAHNVSATVVFEPRKNTSRYLRAKRYYEKDLYTSDNIDRAPTLNWENSGNTSEEAFVSVIGRFNYDYKGKYMVEFAFREDGSYRYAPDQRWGFFPIVSAAWRLSEESFIKNNVAFLSNLKLRASWGRSGEDAGNPFQYIAGYNSYNGYVFDGNYVNGYASTGLINDNLSWVETETVDVGMDVSLWEGAFDFSFDLYRRDRDGLLATRLQALTNTFGASLPQENLNSDRTEGFEFSIGHRYHIGDFAWGITANMNFSRSKTLFKETSPYRSSMSRWRDTGAVGRWQDVGWGYIVDGQYQNYDQIRNGVIETSDRGNSNTLPGDYIHRDVNGNGIIDSGDMVPLFWTGQPKMTYGASIFFSWKDLDFNMLWSGAAKYTRGRSGILGEAMTQDRTNSPVIYYDRWHLADIYDPDSEWVPGKYPAIRRLSENDGANRLESEVRRINASYIRLKNVEVGYTLNQRHLKGSGISKLRLYINMTNPLVICNKELKGFDPEASDSQDSFTYPLTKSYNLGVNITF